MKLVTGAQDYIFAVREAIRNLAADPPLQYERLEAAAKRIDITMTDGEKFSGKPCGYISAANNEPEPESIIIDSTELYTNEISGVSIEE